MPNIKARVTPCERVSLFLVKKETVMGNIGKTQGVATATNPPNNANNKKPKKDSAGEFVEFEEID
jgi:hypothetical protein